MAEEPSPRAASPGRLDKAAAQTLLAEHLEKYRTLTYAELERRIETSASTPEVVHGQTAAGSEYTIETSIVWDDQPQGNLRVMADLAAHPQRPLLGFLPLYFADAIDSFILAPDGRFIGE